MPNHNFDDAFIGRENRKSNYRTWSERAVVVGFNAENQSYDVVITTEKTLGDDLRTVNRVIRNVKAVIDTETDTFLPGESIIVGYVDDRREHPIVIGLGDSGGHTCIKVTLSIDPAVTQPTIEGPGAPSLVDPVFTPTPCPADSFLQDSQTGSTTTLTIDCDTLDITGCFEAEIEAPGGCGCGVYDYSISSPGGTGFTISDQGALATAIGSTTTLAPLNNAGTKLKICPPTNSGGFPGILAYTYVGAARAPANCDCSAPGVCGTLCGFVTWECDDTKLGTGGDTFFCDCVAKCPPGPTGSNKCSALPGVCQGKTPPNPAGPGCGLPECGTPPGTFLQMLQIIEDGRAGVLADCRTAAMLSGGCHPCNLTMPNSILTAEDACGKMFSIELLRKGTVQGEDNEVL